MSSAASNCPNMQVIRSLNTALTCNKISAPAAPPIPPKLRQQLLCVCQVTLWLPGVLPTAVTLPMAEVLLAAMYRPHRQYPLHLILNLVTILQRYSLLALRTAHHCLQLGDMDDWMDPPASRQLQSVGSRSNPLSHEERTSPARSKLPGATPDRQMSRRQPDPVPNSMRRIAALWVRDSLHAAPGLSQGRSDLDVYLGTSRLKRSNSGELHRGGSVVKRQYWVKPI